MHENNKTFKKNVKHIFVHTIKKHAKNLNQSQLSQNLEVSQSEALGEGAVNENHPVQQWRHNRHQVNGESHPPPPPPVPLHPPPPFRHEPQREGDGPEEGDPRPRAGLVRQAALVSDENAGAEEEGEGGEEEEPDFQVVPVVALEDGEDEDDQREEAVQQVDFSWKNIFCLF